MTGFQTNNSALKSNLGFNYQVLIGLSQCFTLKEGESIWIERDGDVSFQAKSVLESVQTEVKNYAIPLTDHHENLWKTLKNWLIPNFVSSKYGSLVLHTTQAFGVNSKLKDWNKLSIDERISILRAIHNERKTSLMNSKKSSVSKLQDEVMEVDDALLRAVLAKVTLFTEADQFEELIEKIFNKLIGIPDANKESYLHSLVGFVYGQAKDTNWTVSYKAFTDKCEYLTSIYRKQEFTFPVFSGYEATESDINSHIKKKFVQKIIEIEHDEMISDALGNWIELQISLHKELDGYPLYKEETKKYQKQLIKRFKLQYSNEKISFLSAQTELADILKKSKLFYNHVMLETPLSMSNCTPPIEYKNGLIHDAMDDELNNLSWRISHV